MPTYDYRCPNGHDFEHFFRKISDAQSEFVCPVCGAVGQRRMSRGAGLVFKGSGFYLTDYGRNAHRTSGPEASGGESKAESKGESKGDSGGASSDSSSASKADGAKSDGGSGGSSTAPKADATVSAKTDSAKSTKSTESKQSGKTKGTSE
jgi:putative FmdB family regulatory protein